MKKLFTAVLGVEEQQADIDTCKIEHLVSAETAVAATRILRFLDEPQAQPFLKALARFEENCAGDPEQCPCCEDVCLVSQVSESNRTPKKQSQTRRVM